MEAMRVGVPGGPHTFAGSAATEISARGHPLVPVWFDRTETMVEALRRGDIDGVLLRPETTATGPGAVYRLLRGGAVRVAGEYAVPFRCLLLARPGARTSEIKQVFGHGALHDCRRRLGELLPRAGDELLDDDVAAHRLDVGHDRIAIGIDRHRHVALQHAHARR